MPILKMAILPHSPLLIPEIGKANYDILDKTNQAYQKIIEECQQLNINTIIIITPHGPRNNDSFIINSEPKLNIDLKEFGYISNTIINGNQKLGKILAQQLKPNWKINLSLHDILDHGSAIPSHIFNSSSQFNFIIIALPRNLELKKYTKFGHDLGQILKNNPTNTAIIASADLSHRLKQKSPGGYSPKGTKFDNKIIECLNNSNEAEEKLSSFDNNLLKNVAECGLRPIITLVGVLNNYNWQAKMLSYQNDFGIGYLSIEFNYE